MAHKFNINFVHLFLFATLNDSTVYTFKMSQFVFKEVSELYVAVKLDAIMLLLFLLFI